MWHLPVSADDALSISSVGSCDHRDGKLVSTCGFSDVSLRMKQGHTSVLLGLGLVD